MNAKFNVNKLFKRKNMWALRHRVTWPVIPSGGDGGGGAAV